MDTIHSISENLALNGTLFGWRIDAILFGVALAVISLVHRRAVQGIPPRRALAYARRPISRGPAGPRR